MSLAVQGVLQPVIRQAVRHVQSTPFTLFVVAVFLTVAALSGSILSGPPESLLPIAGVTLEGLKAGEWWSIWTSLLFTTNVPAFIVAVLMVLIFLGFSERHLGSLRTAGLFLGCQFACVTAFLLVTQVAQYVNDGWLSAMVDHRLIGPYGAVLATGLAASAKLTALWQRRFRTVALSLTLLLVLYVGHPETVVGFLGALVGLVVAWWAQSNEGSLHLHRSTAREVRTCSR